MNRVSLDELIDKGPEALAAYLGEVFDVRACVKGCGAEVSQRRNTPAHEFICGSCLNAWSPKRSRPIDRDGVLEAAGCPLRYRKPFQARPWPVSVNHPNFLVWDWAGDPWIVGFLGESGSGKTHLATELFWRASQAIKGEVVWTRGEDLVNALYGNMGDEGRALGQAAMDAKLLLIDDFGWGVQGAAIEKLFGVINHRYGHMLATIWTSNQSLSVFANGPTGAALTRRLEDGLLVPVKGNWKAAVAAGGPQ